MLRGMTSISYWASDHAAATAWYADLLGVAPYFEMPGYAEFRVGDYQHELGLIDANYAPTGAQPGPGGVILYWHVDDVAATFADLITRGAREYDPITDRGHGFLTASVIDPFGNVLGVMQNPHYVAVLASRAPVA